MIRLPPDFLDLLTALNAAEAKYLLVGGHAVAFHGRPRATKDIDVWIEASPENAARANKRAAGRRQDLADVEALERQDLRNR